MKDVTKWDDVSYVLSSSYRKRTLEKLDSPKTPSTLSKEVNINKTHVSKTLSELEGKNMITCLTKNAIKGKLYIISEYGKEILKEVEKL